MAAWFGLLTGLVEGAGLFVFQELGWLTWVMNRVSVTPTIIWVAPIFDLLLFGVVALPWIVFNRVAPKFFSPERGASFLVLLMLLDWLLLTGRIRHSAALALALGLAVVFYRQSKRRKSLPWLFWRRSLVWLVAVTLLAVVLIEGVPWMRERQSVSDLPLAKPGVPNVIVLLIDTLRADHLSCYGYARKVSPRLDRIAEEGLLFENAFATSSWTLPSHASILTGRFPFEHGAVIGGYDGRYQAIGQRIQQGGYRTAAFSANPFFFTPQRGLGSGFIHFDALFFSIEDMAQRTLYGRKFYEYMMPRLGFEDIPARRRAENVGQALLKWIDGDTRPFFAFVNYFDLHDPYLPPQPFRNMFSFKKNPGGRINSLRERSHPRLTSEQLQEEIDSYDGAIAYVDTEIAGLLTELRLRGLAENTIIVITSDHGESFGEHGLLGHRNGLYLETIRVPLILWGPGLLPSPRRIAAPVSNASIPSTILEILRLPAKSSFMAPSLLRSMESASDQEQTDALAELAHMPFPGLEKTPAYHGTMRALVNNRWHYIVHSKFGEELYDWKKDPGELTNLVDTEEGRTAAAQFRRKLETMAPASTGR